VRRMMAPARIVPRNVPEILDEPAMRGKEHGNFGDTQPLPHSAHLHLNRPAVAAVLYVEPAIGVQRESPPTRRGRETYTAR